MTYALFGSAAEHYDWHTPPHHYQHDHAFVLSRLPPLPSRILDVGCGTGVFLEKAANAGFDVMGLDASPQMVEIASRRVGADRVRQYQMQDLSEEDEYDAIISLSWSFNYVQSFAEAEDVLSRFYKALKPNGRLILQLAHAPNATGEINEDREQGPAGQPDDILFLYSFNRAEGSRDKLIAKYVYGCKSRNELLCEEHKLGAADVLEVARISKMIGFQDVEVLNSWRCEPLEHSVSAFMLACR